MFNWLMNPIYNIISWVLLRWHDVWAAILPHGRFLGTNWDWVFAIVSLVVTVRLVLFPIFVKQIKSQRAMQALAPKIKELQGKHKGDRQALQQEMMKLYQSEKVNPLMGCLPMLLQIPVFFGLFHTLRYIDPVHVTSIAQKSMYGWTAPLFDSAASAQLFGAPIPAAFSSGAQTLALLHAHGPTAKIVAGLLVLIMMFTTFTTQRQMILKTGWQQEPQQKMIQRLMLYGVPVSLLVSGWAFPIGVVIYWVTQNMISLLQQQWVLRKYPPMITASTEAPKTARERLAAANKREPNAIVRFFLVLPPPAQPAGATAGARGGFAGLVARLRGGTTGGTAAVTQPEPAPRSLAPRPGAKPQQRPTASVSTPATPTDDDLALDESPADEQPPTTRPVKAAPTKVTPAKATPARAVPAKAPAAKSTPAKVAPATSNGGAGTNGHTATRGPSIVGKLPAAGARPGTTPATDSEAAASTNGSVNGSPHTEAGPVSAGAATRPVKATGGAGARKAVPAKAGQRSKGGQPGHKRSGKR
jgi:YidC/Oxa1 family membrane protein insertase